MRVYSVSLYIVSLLLASQSGSSLLPAGFKVAVVNDIAAHFEVLAGVVQVLRQLGIPPHIYYAGRVDTPDSLGITDWLNFDSSIADDRKVHWHSLRELGGSDAEMKRQIEARANLVICISAEMAPKVCQDLVTALEPSLLVIWVHRADTATPTSKILKIHKSFKLVALAPHVATLGQQRLRSPVSWAMPLALYKPEIPCGSLSCLNGFVVQGALRKYRSKAGRGFTRNYTQLWERMVEIKQQKPERRIVVCVLGKGGFRSQLEIPSEVDSDVEYLERLPYPEFWGRIYGSFALVPAFGMPVYYESRISSTILASLITGTPLIAEKKLLETYTFFTEEHVFLRHPDEDEVQAMHRILGMTEREVMAKRQALSKLAVDMIGESRSSFKEWLTESGLISY